MNIGLHQKYSALSMISIDSSSVQEIHFGWNFLWLQEFQVCWKLIKQPSSRGHRGLSQLVKQYFQISSAEYLFLDFLGSCGRIRLTKLSKVPSKVFGIFRVVLTWTNIFRFQVYKNWFPGSCGRASASTGRPVRCSGPCGWGELLCGDAMYKVKKMSKWVSVQGKVNELMS